MTSPNRKPQKTNKGANGPEKVMIAKAIRYSRTTLRDRLSMRLLVDAVDRYAALADDTSMVPPGAFRRALRQPVGSRRKPVVVQVGGRSVSVLLNPQGRVDTEREQELWDYLRGVVEGDDV